MYTINLTCKYCDHKWQIKAYSKRDMDYIRCEKCKDKNITYKEEGEKIDYYAGSPPFLPEPTRAEQEHYFF